MKTVEEILICIGKLSILKIGNTSRVQSRSQNTISLIQKFRKYLTKSMGLGSS